MTREEAIRIIGWLKCTTNREDDLEAIDMAIEALSAEYEDYEHATLVDIKEPLKVAVVRCKDCRWYEPKYKDKEYDCPQGLYAVYADDYCSHGERREP